LVVLDRGRTIRVVVAGANARGSIEPPPQLAATTGKALEAFATQLGVGSVVAIERALIGQLSAEIEGALRLDQDGIEQALLALRALKRPAGRGLWTEPPLLELLPAVAFEPLQRTFDLLVPDGAALVAYVIEDDRSLVHTSIIATKQDGDLA